KKPDNSFEISTPETTVQTIIQTKTIIIATGSKYRMLGLASEQKYLGRGVSTCATCDGFFFTGKEIIVVGGGDSAAEESTFLTKFAKKIYVVHRRDTLRASKIMQDRVLKNPKIEMIWNSTVEEILGDGKRITGVRLRNLLNNTTREMTIGGVFLAIGHIPNTKAFENFVKLDEKGYIITDRNMQTSVAGVFASGDVQDHTYRQAITAAGTGCMAAIEAEKYLETHHK
ncbi:thioredoxin-disulfide reductase, partial [Candidatus Woesearchaeota archaeon CG_4_10_14_0_8_um_filter_47_5]